MKKKSLKFFLKTPLYQNNNGQAVSEYVLILFSIILTFILVGFGTSHSLCNENTGLNADQCGNVFVEIGKKFSDNLSALTTLLNLPL